MLNAPNQLWVQWQYFKEHYHNYKCYDVNPFFQVILNQASGKAAKNEDFRHERRRRHDFVVIQKLNNWKKRFERLCSKSTSISCCKTQKVKTYLNVKVKWRRHNEDFHNYPCRNNQEYLFERRQIIKPKKKKKTSSSRSKERSWHLSR